MEKQGREKGEKMEGSGYEEGKKGEILAGVQGRARVGQSDFRVGAVLVLGNGDWLGGFNVEFPGQPLSLAVHAEQSILIHYYHKLVGSGCSGPIVDLPSALQPTKLVVSALPCGYCRQLLVEMGLPDLPIEVDDQTHLLRDLLPNAFTPVALGRLPLAVPIVPSDVGGDELIRYGYSGYTPYSGCASATELLLIDQRRIYSTSIESCAYSMSSESILTAIVRLYSYGYDVQDIVQVRIVTHEGVAGMKAYATYFMTMLGYTDPIIWLPWPH